MKMRFRKTFLPWSILIRFEKISQSSSQYSIILRHVYPLIFFRYYRQNTYCDFQPDMRNYGEGIIAGQTNIYKLNPCFHVLWFIISFRLISLDCYSTCRIYWLYTDILLSVFVKVQKELQCVLICCKSNSRKRGPEDNNQQFRIEEICMK